MAKRLIILLFMALPLWLKAQPITLIDTNCRWSVLTIGMGFFMDTYYMKFDGDTLVDSVRYQKIVSSTDSNFTLKTYEGAAWEVPSEQRVYMMRAGGHCNPPDILCDFSLMQGDTTETYFCAPMKFRVDSVDSIPVDGQLRRRYILNPNNWWPGSEEIIEGIGSTFALAYPQSNFCLMDLEFHLLCVSKNGGVIYMNPYYATCLITGAPESEPIKPVIQIYPNPVSKTAVFEFNCSISGQLEIMDITGRTLAVYEIPAVGQINFDRSGFAGGLYIYRLIAEDEKNVVSGKFMIE